MSAAIIVGTIFFIMIWVGGAYGINNYVQKYVDTLSFGDAEENNRESLRENLREDYKM